MSTYRRKVERVDKDPIVEISLGKEEEEADIDTLGPVYNVTHCIIDKDTSFQQGEIFQVFTNETFPYLPEKDSDIEVYWAIIKSTLHKIAVHAAIFPCAEAISWIIKQAHIDNK